jgi:hypothetical protein
MLPEVGLTYCTSCLQELLNMHEGKESFTCDEEPEVPIARKERAEDYPKNFAILRLAERIAKKNAEKQAPAQQAQPPQQKAEVSRNTFTKRLSSKPSETSFQANTPTPTPSGDMCPNHKGSVIDIVCLDCRERICSKCALFGNHKGHTIREQAAVLEEISVRSEALSELSKLIS